MNITVNHIPLNTPMKRRPGTKMKPTVICVHSTANTQSTDTNERNWLVNPDNTRVASFHYAVDQDSITEAIPPNEVAYHSGTSKGNNEAISIEICESGNREQVLANAKWLIVHLMNQYNITVIKRHHDYSGKDCPRILNTDGKWSGWNKFYKETMDLYSASKGSAKPNIPTSVKTPTGQSGAIGKVEVIIDSLWYYNKPDWNAKAGLTKKRMYSL